MDCAEEELIDEDDKRVCHWVLMFDSLKQVPRPWMRAKIRSYRSYVAQNHYRWL